MDQTFLLTIIIGGSLVYFKQFFVFLVDNIKNLLITSLKIEESSYFFYSFQNFILSEYNQNVNNYYYRNFFDDWIGKDTNINLFYSSGFVLVKYDGVKFLVLKNHQNSQTIVQCLLTYCILYKYTIFNRPFYISLLLNIGK
jgi:hypothetical protein